MPLPRLGQYQGALQHPATAFADPALKAGRVETTPLGLPRVISGGFALTYHVTSGRDAWAVRCFHREAAGLQQRYDAIGRVILHSRLALFVPVEYLTRGVQVDGAWYPVTKMAWIKALPINRYIETNLGSAAIEGLCRGFEALVRDIRAAGIAHGDLQHGNILVDAVGNLRLVDYDGMYVPALRGMAANESGHVNYQHPGRSSQFDAELDRFSTLLIHIALRALAAKPALWTAYSNGDNLLFKRADLLDPGGSALFRDLLALSSVKPDVERLMAICRAPYDAVPTLDAFVHGALKPASRSAGLSAATTPASARRNGGALRSSVAAVVRGQFDTLDAGDVGELVAREGDVVTVVGKITSVRRGLTRFGKPYAFLSCGSYAHGAFTLVLWTQTLDLLAKRGRDLGSFQGRWFSCTGLLMVYRPPTGNPRPQIVVSMPSEVQLMAERQAVAILISVLAVPAPAPANAAGGSADLAHSSASALNRLYGGPPLPAPAPLAPRPVLGSLPPPVGASGTHSRRGRGTGRRATGRAKRGRAHAASARGGGPASSMALRVSRLRRSAPSGVVSGAVVVVASLLLLVLIASPLRPVAAAAVAGCVAAFAGKIWRG